MKPSANLVTGYLGSGKTTLLRNLLSKQILHDRIALIVNDVADLGVDSLILEEMDVDRLVDLPAGCICCSIGSQFAHSVQEIIALVQPDRLLIEMSGLAAPHPVLSELATLGVRVDSVVTLVDATQIRKGSHKIPTIIQQIEEADFIVINKIDLVSNRELDAIQHYLEEINCRALQLPTQYGQVNHEILFATGTSFKRKDADTSPLKSPSPPSVNYHGMNVLSYQEPGQLDYDRFLLFVTQFPESVYRAKGVLRFSDRGKVSLFNYVCGRTYFENIPQLTATRITNRLVVISNQFNFSRNWLAENLAKCMVV